MKPDIQEAIDALPKEYDPGETAEKGMADLLRTLAHRPVPTGRLLRLWSLGTLQARIAAGYLAYWLKSTMAGKDEKERLKNEAHVNAAMKLLGGMGYLRGAIMKVGQTMASYPKILPEQFVETLGSLHFEAPPMHFSLLREHVRAELGSDPEEIFEDFETEAFAAASLGQVHKARLRTGEPIALKIQYPNIARTVADDLNNMKAILTPLKVTQDGENLLDQLEEIRKTLQIETDYLREIEYAEKARASLASDEDIVVPRVYPQHSSSRILAMEYLEGHHLKAYLERRPSQESRNLRAAQLMVATSQLFYDAHMVYADPNPGNFIFMEDGKLGLIDFGCCRILNEEEWEFILLAIRAQQSGGEAVVEVLKKGALLSDEEAQDRERMDALQTATDWLWEPLAHDGEFDFGDDYMERGIEALSRITRKRYLRQIPVNVWNNRLFYGYRALLYQLRPKINLKRVHDAQLERAGLL